MKNKVKIIDILTLVIIVGVLVLALFALKSPPEPTGRPLNLTLVVTRNADLIEKEVRRAQEGYFNNTIYPVEVLKSRPITRNGQKALEIVIKANGQIEPGRIIFNGQRVLIGQKAELHSKFFAQGVISDVK